ncbi:MAG: hypothetical protein R3E64_04165 [Halioglobus sp.]
MYIDGKWCFGWGSPESEAFDPLTTSIWRKRSSAMWPAAKKARLIKAFGGVRATRARIPNLDKVHIHYEPIFSKASTLVRQYRRIPDIGLISIGYQPKADA